MRIAGYLRVSSALQAKANGSESQRLAMLNWARGADIPPESIVWFEDSGVSGKSMDRPQWNAMIGRVRAGEFDTILIYDLSRAGRTLKGLLTWVEEMIDLKVRVVFVKDAIDVNTATGKLIFSLMGSIAEYLRKLSADRIADGIAARQASGKGWGGSLIVDGARKGCRKLTEEQWRAAVERCQDATPAVIARELGVTVEYMRRKVRQYRAPKGV